MKTYKNLYPQICSFDNLYRAWKKARTGKRYTPSATAFEQNLDAELLALYRDLKDECYQPGDYVHFFIHEPKRRLISAAPFRDRVTHHALCNIIEPIYERKFIVLNIVIAVSHGRDSPRLRHACYTFSGCNVVNVRLSVSGFTSTRM